MSPGDGGHGSIAHGGNLEWGSTPVEVIAQRKMGEEKCLNVRR